MTPERWQEVKHVLAAAMEVDRPQRSAWLDQACQGNQPLRDEVESLLHAASQPGEIDTAFGGPAAEQAILATALGQQYEIVRSLGHGGMGDVYLARERALDRFVAIKVLRPDLADAPEIRERFRREAKIAAQLSHPGILPLHTFGEVRGIWYFVMGYVHGLSLADRLRIEGQLSAAESHRILLELTEAVECAHRGGVIHRDIKPANVLLDQESGRAMLADFGISKLHGSDSLTASGMVVGTPHYMAPEQAMGSPDVDERSDIYALGAVGYTMLIGREPFGHVRPQELIFHKVSRQPEPLRKVAPGVPPELADVIMRCLEREPDLRWPTARALRDALRRANGDPVALPEALRDLPTFAPYALLWAFGWSAVALLTARSYQHVVMLLMVAAIVPIGLVLHVWNIGRHGLTRRNILRIALWPPEWWGMWWPRTLRRPNDLWGRLPRGARAVRSILSAIFLLLPSLILVQVRFAPDSDNHYDWFEISEVGLVFAAIGTIAIAMRWALGRGLTGRDAVRLLFGSTAPSPGWTKGPLAPLLAPAKGTLREPERDSPADYRRAILDLITSRDTSASEAAVDAGLAARRLVSAIEECDAELTRLRQLSAPSEIDRLSAQLSTLEQNAGEEERQLAALVRRQLDVVRSVGLQCEVLVHRRTQLFGLLRGIWLHLSALDDDVNDSVAGRLAKLCATVESTLHADAKPVARAAIHQPSTKDREHSID